MKLSNRISRLKPSATRKFVPIADMAKKKGKKVIQLNLGQPDTPTPPVFFEAISNFSKNEKVLSYAPSTGLLPLREEIANFYSRKNMNYTANDILITNGGSESFQFILSALFDEGDEILVPEPFYVNYQGYYTTLNITVRPIPTLPETGFHLPSLEEMEKCMTPKVKAIMFSNPNNPTGTVYSREEVERIIALAEKYDIAIISDEVYYEFAYDGVKTISMGEYPEAAQRVIIIDSVSKQFSATGARIGCIISKNEEFMDAVLRQCQARLSVATLEMIGAEALYKLDPSFFDPIRQEYKERRDCVLEELATMDGVFCKKPEGAFYCLVSLPVDDADDFVRWLLEEFDVDGETILITPVEAFYATEGKGKNEVRICYTIEKPVLKRAMRILREGLIAYNKR